MKIAHFSMHGHIDHHPQLGAKDTGGMEKFVPELARAQARQGHSVTIYTRNQFQPTHTVITAEEGVKLVHLPTSGPPDLWKVQIEQYLDEMVGHVAYNASSWDVLQGHSFLGGYMALRLQEVLGGVFIWTPHSTARYKQEATGKTDATQRIAIEEMCANRADVIVVNSHFEKDKLHEHYDPTSTVYVIEPYSEVTVGEVGELSDVEYDMERFCPHRTNEPPLIVVGRSDPRKQIHELVHLYGDSASIRSRYVLQIYMGQRADGMDTQRDTYAEQVLGIIDRWALWGSVAIPPRHTHGMVHAAMQRAKKLGGVLVHPCESETFGLVILEAAQVGLPVLVRDETAISGLVQRIGNGLAYDGTTDGLESALSEIQLGYQAFSFAGLGYHRTWDTYADELSTHYVEHRWPRPPMGGASGKSRWLVSDLDDTLIGGGGPIDEEDDRYILLDALEDMGVSLIVNTGRGFDNLLGLGDDPFGSKLLTQAEELFTDQGGDIWRWNHARSSGGTNVEAFWSRDTDYFDWVHPGRDDFGVIRISRQQWAERIVEVTAGIEGIEHNPFDSYQHFHKVSFRATTIDAAITLKRVLEWCEMPLKVVISHKWRIVDAIPIRGGKWSALRWWMQREGVHPADVLVVGDSGLDREVLATHPNSAVVQNFCDQLDAYWIPNCSRAYFASKPHAGGVLEAVLHRWPPPLVP